MSEYVDSVGALRTVLSAGFSDLPIFYPNSDTAPTPNVAPDGFVYCENRLQDERQITLGQPARRRDFGEFTIIVYVPRGTRVGVAENYAQQIRALFTVNGVPDVVVTRKSIEAGENVDGPNGRMYAIAVRIDWHSDRLE